MRDCFPSLHTAHTTVVLVFAWRWSARRLSRSSADRAGLYVSTIYLRMHYAVDVLAGFVTAAIAVRLGPRLERQETATPYQHHARMTSTRSSPTPRRA